MAKSKGEMGFRGLHGFNLALLGKQLWNFMSNPDALVTHIFKARYFSDCHLLKAKRGAGSSFLWTGLWETKEELYKGYRWVLGDGMNIEIFRDPWLRGKRELCVEDYHDNNVRPDKVCAHFRSNTKEWDEHKVCQTFLDEDVKCILQTRVPQIGLKDRVAWMATVDGKYTVKSGYHY